MIEGIYEQLVTEALDEVVKGVALQHLQITLKAIEPDESHEILAEHLKRATSRLLARIEGEGRLEKQRQVCNELLAQLHVAVSQDNLSGDIIAPDPRRLLAVVPEPEPLPERPDTPLALGCLLTGTRLDPSLVSQLRKEISTADGIDILCSFIKWGGVRIIEEQLRRFTARPGARLRIITTSYLGATDLKAVEFLAALPNTQLRVSYDTHRTRLHAKAYIFNRSTGFGSAYIGSANLSHAALTDGLEWTVKVSQYEQHHLWEKVSATFETYWNDAEFALYARDQRERLAAALMLERNGSAADEIVLPTFDLRPYGFQQEILEQLQAERTVLGRDRQLVVAATGTGKTMIAAFDFRQWRRGNSAGGSPPRLLFVAHREEILKKSLATFRAVLKDYNFGDLLVGSHRPDELDQLFVSIQSYNSHNLVSLAPEQFDYVVVDEFHHAAAPTYRRLLEHVRPKVLLGLTATPERADGLDIGAFFGGHVSAEIRLPDAINRKLLSPFQYFGITDNVDLSGETWQRGGYRVADLDRLYTGNDLRAQLVIEKVQEKLLEARNARGLGFCVSVAHAQFMAEHFRRAGIPAEALWGESDDKTRSTIQQRLVEREINFIFTVDLYNEGVDIPEVDTVLFLRPTESLTVFLQQLGRGLRLCEDKDCLTVLDFIGQAHRAYRFDLRYRALLSDPSRNVARELEDGFAYLPAGCTIQMERLAAQHVLDNISKALDSRTTTLVSELKDFSEGLGRIPAYDEFLDHFRLLPDDIYRRNLSWSRLCTRAELRPEWHDPDEERLTKGLRRLAHISSPTQIRQLLTWLRPAFASTLSTEEAVDNRIWLMAHLSLWGDMFPAGSPDESLKRLRSNPTLLAELQVLLAYRLEKIDHVPLAISLPFACPLEVHASYTRDEIMAGLGYWTWNWEGNREMREGVLHLPSIKTDAFLFTLHKTESDYSPTTMYRDYAISENLIHWQSQSTTSADAPTGRRYIEHAVRGHTILLFAREYKGHRNLAAPYEYLGPVDYVRHEGSRPISFVWRLRTPLPARLYRRMARLAVG